MRSTRNRGVNGGLNLLPTASVSHSRTTGVLSQSSMSLSASLRNVEREVLEGGRDPHSQTRIDQTEVSGDAICLRLIECKLVECATLLHDSPLPMVRRLLGHVDGPLDGDFEARPSQGKSQEKVVCQTSPSLRRIPWNMKTNMKTNIVAPRTPNSNSRLEMVG